MKGDGVVIIRREERSIVFLDAPVSECNLPIESRQSQPPPSTPLSQILQLSSRPVNITSLFHMHALRTYGGIIVVRKIHLHSAIPR